MKNAVNFCLLAILIFMISIFSSNAQDTTAIPRLIIPKDSTWNISPYTTLYWHKVNDAEVYRIQYSKIKDMSDSKFIVTNDTSYYFEEPLELFTWYYWKVQAGRYINPNKDIVWFNLGSKTWKFRTNNEILWPIFLMEITSPVEIHRNFKWNKVPGSKFYRFQLAPDTLFNNLVVDTILSDTIITNVRCRYRRNYCCRVNAFNELDTGRWSQNRFFYTGTQFPYFLSYIYKTPKPGTIKQPINGTIEWLGFVEAGYNFNYQIQLFLKTDTTLVNIIDTVVTDSLISYHDLEYKTNYIIKLKVMSEDDTSNWGQSYFRTEFDTLPELPLKVELLEPKNNDTIYFNIWDPFGGKYCSWDESSPFVDKYSVEIDSTIDFSNPYIDSNVSNTSSGLWYYDNFLESPIYYWRVRAYNESGWGPYSDTWKFYLVLVGINDDYKVSNENLIVYPNPISDFACIKIKSKEQGKSVIIIYNILGIEVEYIEYENSESGETTINWKTQSLPSGTYFMKTRIGGREIVKPIQIF